jgi:hypothetical protein
MSKDTNEQKLAKILEVKNSHMAEAQKDMRIAFSVLNGLRSELDGELTEDQFQSLSDALLIVSSVFMSLLDAQVVEKYWNLDS